MAAAIPVVERADHADPLGVGRPHREVDAGQTRHLAGMRPQLFKNLVVVALGEQMTILVAQDREGQRIGIGEDLGLTVLGCAQPVTQCGRAGGDDRFKQSALIRRLQGIQQIGPVFTEQAG